MTKLPQDAYRRCFGRAVAINDLVQNLNCGISIREIRFRISDCDACSERSVRRAVYLLVRLKIVNFTKGMVTKEI